MSTPKSLSVAGVTALLLLAVTAVGAADDPTAWFQVTTQKLYDAVALGDKAPWEAVLDTDCMVTTEDGDVFDRAKFLEELRPLPSGFSGQIKVRGLTVRSIGDVAIVHYWLDEVEDIFDQRLKTTYVETDAYRRSQGAWKAVSHSGWPALLGDYHYNDQAKSRYQVFMRDGALYGGRDLKSATELIPLAPLVFYQKDSIHIMVFVQDRSGAINEVRELHKYNEVRMHRVSAAAG
jgi:hypothetical protein